MARRRRSKKWYNKGNRFSRSQPGYRKWRSRSSYYRNTSGKHYYKLRGVFTLATDVAGQNRDVLSLTNPGAYLNGASALPDLSNLTALYDNLRVCAVKLKYIPLAPNDVAATYSFVPMYIVNDFDDETALSAVTDAVQYETCHSVNLARQWKHYVKVPKVSDTAANSVSYGWFDIATVPNRSGIKFYASGLSGGKQYGTIIATYYVGFKNRR